ncbi:MAG TPA: hypothetical protein VFE91_02785, partial [Nitrososphaerales archaeon]|nr:hypothetical protein [Nitrososphaerales archaeon]
QPRVVVMKAGKVLEDGPSAEVMMKKGELSQARVAQPEMVAFYEALASRPGRPFVDPLEARRWVEGGMKK